VATHSDALRYLQTSEVVSQKSALFYVFFDWSIKNNAQELR